MTHLKTGHLKFLSPASGDCWLADLEAVHDSRRVMDSGRMRKMRFLYLLALAQLVGGPLVLLHISAFCRIALHEIPRQGMICAVKTASTSFDVQSPLLHQDIAVIRGKKAPPSPGNDPKVKCEKAKSPFLPWQDAAMCLSFARTPSQPPEISRIWTPAWPQAPPGPPPRLG